MHPLTVNPQIGAALLAAFLSVINGDNGSERD